MEFSCADESKCIIDCSMADRPCSNMHIRAETAASLEYKITKVGGGGTQVYCPEINGGRCDVECIAAQNGVFETSCSNMKIHASKLQAGHLSISCKKYRGNPACEDATVTCPSWCAASEQFCASGKLESGASISCSRTAAPTLAEATGGARRQEVQDSLPRARASARRQEVQDSRPRATLSLNISFARSAKNKF